VRHLIDDWVVKFAPGRLASVDMRTSGFPRYARADRCPERPFYDLNGSAKSVVGLLSAKIHGPSVIMRRTKQMTVDTFGDLEPY
jgi:hypothetical protein